MKLGICTEPETFQSAPAGLDYLEVGVQNVLVPQEDQAKFRVSLEAVKACPVPVEAANCFLPASLKSTGPEVDQAALDAYVRTAMARANQVGIEIIVFGSGGSRRVPDGFDRAAATEQLAGHLKRWGAIAAECGVTIVVEPLRKEECNIITSVGEGADLVRRVGHVNVRLLADTYHMACDDDPSESIVEAGDLIAHVHCAEKQDRAAPGTHGEDLSPYWRALMAAGYTGRVSVECRWDDLPRQAAGVLAALKKQIDQA